MGQYICDIAGPLHDGNLMQKAITYFQYFTGTTQGIVVGKKDITNEDVIGYMLEGISSKPFYDDEGSLGSWLVIQNRFGLKVEVLPKKVRKIDGKKVFKDYKVGDLFPIPL